MKLRGFARLALLVIPVAAAAAPIAAPRLATAAGTTIVVGSFDDPVSTGDCSGAANGTATCTLRAAILQANSDNSGDIVRLGAGTYTLKQNASAGNGDSGVLGDLEVVFGMTIQGAGPTQTVIQGVGPDVSTAWNDRIIEVADEGSSPPSVTISGLTVTGGKANASSNTTPEADGGGILSAGSNLTLNNVVIDGNTSSASGGGVASEGMGTSDDGSITITHSTIANNTAAANGGGLFVAGANTTADSFTNLFITGNTANGAGSPDAGGGAIYDGLTDGGGSASFTDLMVTKNHAPAMSGGGIYEENGLAGGATYSKVTLSKNDAKNFGGGIYVNEADTGATTVTMTNATITGNSVIGGGLPTGSGSGGGVGLLILLRAVLILNNATISGNTGTQPGAGVALMANGDRVEFHNTLVVQNTNTTAGATSNCSVGGATLGTPLVSNGYNLADDTTCAFTNTSDRQGSTFNPDLGALQDNTGPVDGAPGDTSPTLTEALPKGSIAIDTADPALANNPATDERGITRPQGTASDVGAYEAIPPVFVAPILPAAGHLPSGPPSSTVWALLILAVATAAAAAALGLYLDGR
jgi:hypothetical protein